MASTTEQVDVAIVGAGLAGLATAVALHRVRPDAKIKVYERRKAPAGYVTTTADAQNRDDSTSGSKGSKKSSKDEKDSAEAAPVDPEAVEQLLLGGGVRLEMNGLKAIAAISRDLAGKVVSEGLYANKVLLHDTQGGAVMTRLHEPPHPSSPSPRQPALMIGWSELEALLLNRLPPGTVEWESVAASYTNSPTGVTLNLLKPSEDQDAVPSHALSTAMTHALDTELHQHMEQQRFELGTSDNLAVPSSPFSAAAGTNPFSGTGPAPAAAPVAAAPVLTAPRLERLTVRAKLLVAADGPMSLIRQQCIGDGEPNFEGMVRWVGRLPGDMLSTIPVEQEAWWMGGGMTFASHPLSNGDVAWEAQVSSACLAKAGLKWDQQTQAIIKDSASSTPAQASTAGGGSGSSSNADAQRMVAPAVAAAAAAPAGSDDGDSGFGGFSTSNGTGTGDSQVKRNSRSATPADAPAGEEQSSAATTTTTTTTPAATAVGALAAAAALAQAVAAAPESPASASGVARQGSDAGLSSLITPAGASTATANGPVGSSNGGSGSSVRHVKISPAKPTTMTYDAADGNSSSLSAGQPVCDAKALLLQLFADFPTACLDMIETTDGAAILEGPVLTRAARQMPACMGRGGVVVLGEAAHPVRPSGQEASQAFEDAAEFGAAVMQWGINREALRRFELTRRPRWTHAMQVSQAFGSVTNLGGVALHQGLLDYTAQLYHMRFTPLRTMYTPPKPQKKRRNPLLHWTGVALLTYGTLAAAGVTHRHLAKEGKSPLGQVKDPVAQAVVGAVDAVGQSAVKVVSTAADAVLPVVQSPGQTAAAIKNAATKGVSVAKKGVSATVEGSGQAAAVIGRQVGKVAEKVGGNNGADSGSDGWVHGEVPPRHKQNVFARVRDGTVKRVLGAGVFLSRPFTHVLGHQVRGTVAETLGAF